ncbi:MAG: DNA-directed RNA polymerase subunit beta' [Parcubacteria group bacterium Gr01-1014_30]|nr:MAG: DNA-directed RNA polymerase subunit beta' [Parcubacteria group bacterium Gr01-1014_30]
MRVQDLEAIRIKLASPDDILSWSHGEVTKPETINYRTQRAEKDGLFCEKIFGPEKDYECYCGKYKRIRYKGVVCDRCGVEVTKASVRRERMGHIKLATPCSHIWFLRGVPSRISMVLDIPMQQLERVIYFASYIVTGVKEEAKKKVLEEIEKEYKAKLKAKSLKVKANELKAARDKAKQELLDLKPLKILSEVEYHELASKYGEVFEAGTGAETLRKVFEKVDLKKEISGLRSRIEDITPPSRRKALRRLKTLQAMERARVRPEWMFLTQLPVLPPELRPMVQLDGGRYASSDLNDLYRRVINRNNRLKYLLEIEAPEVIVRNEKRMLQEAVDALIDNSMRKGTMTQATTGGKRLLKSLSDMLKGKQGRFRQNLLGKRVDYSGRSVIVVGPNLKVDQCGLPKVMALELFKPFIIKKILEKELAYNVRGASRVIEEGSDEVWESLEEVVQDKLVLLNRAPTLHRLGIQAFKPVLIEGSSIQMHPMVCRAFNADFDGDQMAVHLPLSEDAQKEASSFMLSSLNLLKPATGQPIVTIYQDMSLGCYWLTKIVPDAKGQGMVFGSREEALLYYEYGRVDLKAKIKVRIEMNEFIETSVGRLIFNEALPEGFPFQNSNIRVNDLERIVKDVIEKYDSSTLIETLDKIKELGFEYSTLSGLSWGMDDLTVPPEKKQIIVEAEKEASQVEEYARKGLLSQEEKKDRIIEVWTRAKSAVEKLVPKTLPEHGPVFSFIDAGARGTWSQPVQMAGMKGLVANPLGETIELPVKNSFKEGFDILEYFISTHGARKGTVDTALRTSTAGYLTRRLIDVAHEVVVSQEDCKDEDGIELLREYADSIAQSFVYKIVGRLALDKIQDAESKLQIVKKGEIIDWKKAEKIVEAGVKKVKVRSILSCKAQRGVCRQCYGWDLGNNKLVKLGEAVGIVAAQAIGEPGTQLTMRTFHLGGVAGVGDITSGLPRIQEIFEAREPGGKAVVSHFDGEVLEVTQDRVIKIKPRGGKKTDKQENVEYRLLSPKMAVWVSPGQKVQKGQQLTEGNIDLREFFKLVGEQETKAHIVREVQRIYVFQGVAIHDKHIEVIVRQMFSRVRVKDPGDSSFVPGEVVSRLRLHETNAALKKEEKKPAKGVPILLGISQAALTTDSFLSAASFQETSRVLIRAATEGAQDQLKGLKENVIIGKLIPVGTGFRK